MLGNKIKTLFLLLFAVIAACANTDEEETLDSVDQLITPTPQNLRITAVTATRVTLEWDEVPNVTRYIIWRGTSPGTETQYTSVFPETATTWTNSNLTPNATYCYFVKAYIQGDTVSAPSNEVCTNTSSSTPPAPTGLQANPTSNRTIQLTWNPVASAYRYQIFQNIGGTFTLINSVAAPTTTYTVDGLQPQTSYTFAIKTQTVDNFVSALSAPASATTLAEGSSVYYRFDDKTGSTALDGSGGGRNGTLAGGAVFVTTDQAPLKDPTDHNYSSVSFPTATSVVNTPVATSFTTPTSLSMWIKVTALPATTLELTGRRSAGCGPIGWLLSLDSSNTLHFQGSTDVSFGQGVTLNDWTHIGVTFGGGTVRLYIDGIAVANGSHTSGPAGSALMQIGAAGGCANSGAFLADEFQVVMRTMSDADMMMLGQAPPPPTNLRATELHSKSVRIEWDAVQNATKYYIYKGTSPGNTTFLTTFTGTSYLAGNLQPNTTTYWRIFTVRNGLISETSTPELAVTTLGPPPAPTNLVATQSTCCTPPRADLSWTAEPRATRYLIYQSVDGGAFALVSGTQAPKVTFTSSPLTVGSSYSWYVVAVDDNNTTSAPSNTASLTPI